MNPRALFLNVDYTPNVGDLMCGAFQLFQGGEFAIFPTLGEPPDAEVYIVGGGGMLHPGLDQWILDASLKAPTVLLGVGLNYHDDQEIPVWQDFVKHCALVGLRDRYVAAQNDMHWCPDPTVWSNEWALSRLPVTEHTLVYEHLAFPMRMGHEHTARNSRINWLGHRRELNLRSACQLFSPYQNVVTNSYHGVLWAALSGCRVVLKDGFSTKFSSGFGFPVPDARDYDTLDNAFDAWDAQTFNYWVRDAKAALRGFLTLVTSQFPWLRVRS
jgi:hypothetical protein